MDEKYPITYIDDKTGKVKTDIVNLEKVIFNTNKFLTVGGVLSKTYYYEDGIYKEKGEKYIGELCEKLSDAPVTNNQVKEIIGCIQRKTYGDKKDLDCKNLDIICVQNGILNIKTRELIPHTPDIMFTQKINAVYNKDTKCPKFTHFLIDLLDEKDIPVLQEFLGSVLYRTYTFKKAIILYGQKNCGKSTLINTLINFINEDNCSEISLHSLNSNKFAASQMEYKLINFFDDLSFQDLNDVSAFKMATGNGNISAEKKFGEQFFYKNYAKQIFAANKLSRIKDDDDAYYERWLIFNFINQFNIGDKEQINDYSDILNTEEEHSGMLNWALDGYDRLMKNGKFSYNKTSEDNKIIMSYDSDDAVKFISDILIYSEGYWISKEDMFNIYIQYCRNNKFPPLTKETLGKRLSNKSNYILNGNKSTPEKRIVHGWLNVKINMDTDMGKELKKLLVDIPTTVINNSSLN